MTIWAALAAAVVAAVAAGMAAISPSAAKEGSPVGASARDGVTLAGSSYRYVAYSPGTRPRLTVIERIDRAGGHVDRWWFLEGGWTIPAGQAGGEGSGLSASGGTLVLASPANGGYGPRSSQTRLAVLDTEVRLRSAAHPDGVQMSHAVRQISLPGRFELTSVSADGSTAYLAQAPAPAPMGAPAPRGEPGSPTRALDLASGRLSPVPAPEGAPRRDGPLTFVRAWDQSAPLLAHRVGEHGYVAKG